MVVSDLNSEFQIFFRGQFRVFGQFRIFFPAHSELISELYAEIHQNPLFFHENIFFLIRKSPNTPNSIFRANIWNLLLRSCFINFTILAITLAEILQLESGLFQNIFVKFDWLSSF